MPVGFFSYKARPHKNFQVLPYQMMTRITKHLFSILCHSPCFNPWPKTQKMRVVLVARRNKTTQLHTGDVRNLKVPSSLSSVPIYSSFQVSFQSYIIEHIFVLIFLADSRHRQPQYYRPAASKSEQANQETAEQIKSQSL